MGENTDGLQRFGVSMPKMLMDDFDDLIEQKGYNNRSEAIRDLVRKAILDKEKYDSTEMAVGTIGLIYDHHAKDLAHSLADIQHNYYELVISNVHVHLPHNQCLEVLLVKGPYGDLAKMHQQMKVHKGVTYAELSVYLRN